MIARKEVDPIFSGNAPHTRIPVGNYMFKVSNRNTKTRCEICPKLTIKTLLNRRYIYHITNEQ